MARVDIPGIGMKTFPDSMSDKEILAQANILREKAAQPQQPLLDPKDLPLGQIVKGGFSRGLEGLKGTALDLIPALGASIFGKDDYAKEQLKEYQDRMAAAEQANPTAYKSYKEIGGFGDALGFGAETLGEVGPDLLSFFTGVGAGASVGKYAATKGAQKLLEKKALNYAAEKGLTGEAAKQAAERYTQQAIGMDIHANIIKNATANGASIGQKVGLFGTAGGLNIPETFNKIYEDTGNLEPGIALTMGSLKSALDTYLPSKILKQLGPSGKDRVAAAMLDKSNLVPITFKRAFTGEVLKTISGEGLTEGTQEAIDILASQIAGDENPFFSQKNIDSIITASLKGAIGGTAFGSPSAALEAKRIKSARANEIARQEQLQQQEQGTPPALSSRELASKTREEKQLAALQQINQPSAQSKSAFETQEPDLLGFYKNLEQTPSQVAPEETDPIVQRMQELYEEFVSKGLPPAQATRQAYEQARAENQNDTMYSVESGEVADPRVADPRQGVLQFAPPAPEAQANTQMANQLQAAQKQQDTELTYQRAEQEKQAQLDRIAQQTQIQQQLDIAGLNPEQTSIPVPTANGAPAVAQQLDLFGERGRPSRAEGISQGQTQSLAEDLMYQEPQINTVLDADTLKSTGLKTQSGFYKQLLGKDMANPNDQVAIGQILTAVRANPSLTPQTKDAIERIANQGFTALAQQQEMFNAKNGIKRGADYGRVQPRPVDTGAGTSVLVPNEELPGATEGIATSEQQGVGPNTPPATESAARETLQPDTLTETVPVETAPTPPAATGEDVYTKAAKKYIAKLEADLNKTTDPQKQETLRTQIDELENKLYGEDGRFRTGQGEGMAKADVESHAADVAKGWKNAPPVKVVNNQTELPKHLQDQIEKEGIRNPKGVWDPRTQSVYLVANNLGDKADVTFTILHEITGHFGLQKILGDKFNSVMNQIYNGNKDVKDRADIKMANGMDKSVAVEEVLAEMAETATNPSLIQKVINIIRQALRAIGIQFKDVTNGEIRQLLQDSRKFVTGSAGVVNGGNIRLGGVFNADAPIFYSQLASMVAGAPKQFDNASEQQWRDWITSNASKNQVKEEELEYSGIKDYLNFGRSKNEKISREQLMEFLKDEGPKVTETIYGGENKNKDKIEELREQSTALRLEVKEIRKKMINLAKQMISGKHLTEPTMQMIDYSVRVEIKEVVDSTGATQEEVKKGIKPYGILRGLINEGNIDSRNFKTEQGKEIFKEYKNLYQEEDVYFDKQEKLAEERNKLEEEETPTRFETFTFKRGYKLNNYRELILTLPTKKPTGKLTVMQNGDFATYSVNDENINQIGPNFNTAAEAREWLANYKGGADYKHPHWININNPLVHIRFDEVADAKGNRVLNVQELQSDWGQEWGLPEGYKLLDLRNAKENAEARSIVGDAKIDYITRDTNPMFNTNFVYTNGSDYNLVDFDKYTNKPNTKKEATKLLMEDGFIPKVADAPFITEPRSYTALAIKRLLRYAADNGYDKISFISGEEAHKRFPTTQDGKSTKKGMQTHYDERIPSVVKDIFKKLGANPNARTEKIKVFPNRKYFELFIKDQYGRVQSYAQENSIPNINTEVLYQYDQRFGLPVVTKDLEDPSTGNIVVGKGQSITFSALRQIETAGLDFKYILENLVEKPMEFDIRNAVDSGVKEQFTIDLTPEASAKVKQGQAMFRAGEATFRTNPSAPGVTSKDAKSVFDSFTDRIENTSFFGPTVANNIDEFFRHGIVGNARKAAMWLLPLKPLTEEAKRAGLFMAPELNKTIDEQSGFVNGLNQSIEPLVKRAEDWAKKSGKQAVNAFNDVVYDSTISKIDPTKPKKDETTPGDYKRIVDKFNKLNDMGKTLYKNIRDANQEMYENILNSIEERINTFVTDPNTRALLKEDVLEKLAKRGRIDPYFALTRTGNYWLSYNLNNEPYVEAYTTERERNKQAALVEKEGAEPNSIQKFTQLSEYKYGRAPSGSFVNKMLHILEANKPQGLSQEASKNYDEASDQVMRLYLSTLPETSFAQSFQKRKETLGFEKDAIGAMRDKLYSTAQQLGRMKYSAKLNKILEDMRTYAKLISKGYTGDTDDQGNLIPAKDAQGNQINVDNGLMNSYISVFEKHVNAMSSPQGGASRLLNTIGFNYLLGFNLSSALVNTGQVPMIVTPYLAGEHTWGSTTAAIGKAYRTYMQSGYGEGARSARMIGSDEIVKQKAMPSITNYGEDTAMGKHYKTLVEEGQKLGQFNRSQFYDVLEVDGRKNWNTTLNAASGFAFHHGERMNREVTMMAAYDLQLAKLKKQGKTGKEAEIEAAMYAFDVAETTNGGVSSASSPLIAKNDIGKVLFMFKRYGVSMYYMLFKVTRDALQNQDKAVKKAAMSQIAGIYGTSALFAGLQGIPMFGVAAMIYNLFKDDDEDDMETATRKYVGEFAYKGMLNHLTGSEIASRTSLSDLIFRSNPSGASSTFQENFLQMFGGPAYGVGSRIKRGLDFMNEGNMQRGIENVLPSAFGNMFKAARFATEGAQNLRGDPIVEDINAFSIAAQALGFAPAEYTRQLEINSQLKGIEKDILQSKTKLLQKWNIAKSQGDYEDANKYKDKLKELNAKHPKLEINDNTFEASERAFKAASKRTVNGVQFSQKLYDEMMQRAAEYDGK
jgi:hypothetical protein